MIYLLLLRAYQIHVHVQKQAPDNEVLFSMRGVLKEVGEGQPCGLESL